ncbi:unnamed protein product [Rotaria socialis]|uniref:Uncharacterized protein n=1 Tax=Rotaria socialis TaxID=392032 RepID=A0A817Z4R7_9BILA|nr:unnamed protein product [Rotaria socialis]
MVHFNPDQPFNDPSFMGMPPNFNYGNGMFLYPPTDMRLMQQQKKPLPPILSRIPSLHLPAIILFTFCWILHGIATFLPYWSTYSGISDSRAGLWNARNFNYSTIQNFYFPETTDFPNLTNSIDFSTANTKGYLITVQFLMTFNFSLTPIILVLLIVDYIFSLKLTSKSRCFLIRDYNTSDTAIKYALLLYIIYVFDIFEFAAWITYLSSRHDNNWNMHISFAFTVIVSALMIIVFIMYAIEFMKTFTKSRLNWDRWYGPYAEWAFFVFLSALLLLLIVICCPEWAYAKYDPLFVFAEIGLFKQCYLSSLYKKTISSKICTLSDLASNTSWVNATQAFMLMAYIFGMIILVAIVYFRKEFRHKENGYYSKRCKQPTFTYIIAGFILFFCFIFSLIGVAVFGGKVFSLPLNVNWGYILAVIAMTLFLVAGILFILDGIHSGKQTAKVGFSTARKLIFPAPLNHRVLAMQPLLRKEPTGSLTTPFSTIPPLQLNAVAPQFSQQIPPFYFPEQAMYPMVNFDNTSFYSPEQMAMMSPNYGMGPYSAAPFTQAVLTEYIRQMENNPRQSSLPNNQGLMNHSNGRPSPLQNNISNESNLNGIVRLHLLQQQRLHYNHERLLERYTRVLQPRLSEFRTFGTSSLHGRNYDEHLRTLRNDNYHEDSSIAMSRAGIGSSDEIYRWIGDESYEALPRNIDSAIQYTRNESMPYVNAENFETVEVSKFSFD